MPVLDARPAEAVATSTSDRDLQMAYAKASTSPASAAAADAAPEEPPAERADPPEEPEVPEAEIGVFGGSGFYSFLDDVEEVEVETPYGKPSAPIAIGEVGGKRVAFLPRHGRDHELPPAQIPYRANVWAMKELGVRRLIGPNASGALQADLELGEFVVCDQFVDRTSGRARHVLRGAGDDARLGRRPVLPRPAARCSSRRRASSGSRSATAARSSSSRGRASRRAPSRSGSRTRAGT